MIKDVWKVGCVDGPIMIMCDYDEKEHAGRGESR